jgi:glycosyltransferase involved in cell wall biosynthesis
MESIRVLQVITPSRLAGAEIYVGALSQALAARGAEVVVLCKKIPQVVERMRQAGLDVRAGGIGGKLNLLSVFRLFHMLRKERIELVNSHLSTASLMAGLAGRLSGVPTVATVHSLNSAACFRLAGHLIAVSQAVKKHLVGQGIPPERITVIYPGVDLGLFSRSGNGSVVRQELGIPPQAVVVGMVGHLSRKKGHHVLLSAAERIVAARPDCRFLIVGGGPLMDVLEQAAGNAGLGAHVIFTGFRADVRDMIEAMDIVVQPSVAGEGLPASLLQAMALCKPVVASDLSGIPEIVEQDKTGLLVTPGDAGELAEAVLKLARDGTLRAEMGSAARERAETLFDFRVSVDRTLALYEEMVERRRV